MRYGAPVTQTENWADRPTATGLRRGDLAYYPCEELSGERGFIGRQSVNWCDGTQTRGQIAGRRSEKDSASEITLDRGELRIKTERVYRGPAYTPLGGGLQHQGRGQRSKNKDEGRGGNKKRGVSQARRRKGSKEEEMSVICRKLIVNPGMLLRGMQRE